MRSVARPCMFRRKPAPDLIRGGRRFADKNMRQSKNPKASSEISASACQGGHDRRVHVSELASSSFQRLLNGLELLTGDEPYRGDGAPGFQRRGDAYRARTGSLARRFL